MINKRFWCAIWHARLCSSGLAKRRKDQACCSWTSQSPLRISHISCAYSRPPGAMRKAAGTVCLMLRDLNGSARTAAAVGDGQPNGGSRQTVLLRLSSIPCSLRCST